MNVYVASKYENVAPVRALQEALKAKGHNITFDWTREPENWSRERRAIADFNGVMWAEIVIVLSYPNIAGAYTELGIALARGATIVVVDKDAAGRTNIFHDLPQVIHVKTADEAMAVVDAEAADNPQVI